MTIVQKFAIDDREFAGKRVLVTGGTKGAGEAIVHRLSAAGAVVLTTARSATIAVPPSRPRSGRGAARCTGRWWRTAS